MLTSKPFTVGITTLSRLLIALTNNNAHCGTSSRFHFRYLGIILYPCKIYLGTNTITYFMYYGTKETILGLFIIAGDDEGIKEVNIQTANKFVEPDSKWIKDFEKIKDIATQLEAYSKGELTIFDVKLAPDGTEFQKRVWHQLLQIPYGKTASYLDIAKAIKNPNACRAVGMANSKNPIQIIIPCHRIIGSNNTMTGYAGGVEMKKRLLQLEHGNIKMSPDMLL
jgi:methylated-DNA-[protein]-cysteine S-methyltransferase